MFAAISLEAIVMKTSMLSAISCLPPLIIAAVVSVATPSFAMSQMEGRGGAMPLPIGLLHDRLKLTEQRGDLRVLSCKMEACREVGVKGSE